MRKKSVGQLNDNVKSSISTAYQRGNNRDGSPHYVFLYSDDDDDDDEEGNDNNDHGDNSYLEQIPLQSRKTKSRTNIYPRKVEVITVILKPEDTLQALSLRYRCTISELKRINNIHKENEIFARRILKVPVQPFSIFTEMTENNQEQQNEFANSTINLLDNTSMVTDGINSEEQNKIMNVSTTSSANNNSDNKIDDVNNIILNSLSIDPLRNDVVSDNFEVNNTENDELLLINDRDRDSTPEARVIEWFGCSGADWGLTWVHLLGASLLFGFVLPVVLIIIITENEHENHHTNMTNSTR